MIDTLKGKTILITGGTGSFGKNFAKHILANSEPKKLIIFSRDEFKQSNMQKEMHDPRLRFFIGDVRDLPRLMRAFEGVDVVVHAAALKQVPALEYNPFEAVKTNILGSQNIIEASLDRGVERAVLVSTDKAAMPVNLYGSTKLCAEKLFTAANEYGGGSTRFSVVRYGNVVGSRGSIVEHLIKNKNATDVYITDERMTRFWVSLEQAFEIVLFALSNTVGGEIFVPKAPAMRITELFNHIVPTAKRNIIGIRPGEKLHELLLTQDEARHSVDYKDYYVVLPENFSSEKSEHWQKYTQEGKALAQDFYFASNANATELSKDVLSSFIKEIENSLR